ncbi:MAG: TonB-dependent siderophore receptor [Nostoc sp.]|uniref:TonB-dependent siderophore receptor n=1 Tax=Nostoc sp. TaxID=1180 RepID=UPI002FF4EDA0
MRIKRSLSNSWLLLVMVFLPLLMAQSVQAEVKQNQPTAFNTGESFKVTADSSTNRKIRRRGEIEHPATNASGLLSQSSTSQATPASGIVPITGVKANPTSKGVEVILETPVGTQLQVTNRSSGNNFIVDVSGGQLRLLSGDAFRFRSQKPVEGITEITAQNIDANTVRVTVVGEKTLPTVELFDDDAGLVFAVATTATAMQPPQTPQTQEKPASQTPSTQGDEPIELVVTGEQDNYRVPNSSVGTRTDTPLRDIPQSIQVIPQQVLRDQNAPSFNEALRNVPGLTANRGSTSEVPQFSIRGFRAAGGNDATFLRNGLRDAGRVDTRLAPNIERIEVLLGPASVLYGIGNPGGTINIVTKQPLRDPFYAVDTTIGNYDFYQGAIDLSGPLNDSKSLLYRFNAGYQNSNSFVDFYNQERFTIAPVISWDISQRTHITLEGEYTDRNEVFDSGLPAVGTVLPNLNGKIRRGFFAGDPNSIQYLKIYRLGYRLEHQFSNNWSLQQAFQWGLSKVNSTDRERYNFSLDADNRILSGLLFDEANDTNTYDLNVNLTGRFSTGSIGHQITLGTDLGRYERRDNLLSAPTPPLDLFNPVYGQPAAGPYTPLFVQDNSTDTLGIYVQDQVKLAENLKLLLGGRFDLFKQTTEDFITDTRTEQSGNAFSPRVGIVYQPIGPISLYANYNRSFTPVTGRNFEGDVFEPERSTQYEVGAKADLNSQLSATLSFYDLTRTGVLTNDPNNSNFSIQTGEQRSRGIELSVQGEILPGWNIIAGYAYTNAQVTEDNTIPVGNRLANVPENALNFWTSYEIQRGSMKGFGVSLGFFFTGERQGDLDNSYQLPSYLRTDAAIFYKRDRFRAGLNFRNLFDVTYLEASDYKVGNFYGEPFTVQGTIRWEF